MLIFSTKDLFVVCLPCRSVLTIRSPVWTLTSYPRNRVPSFAYLMPVLLSETSKCRDSRRNFFTCSRISVASRLDPMIPMRCQLDEALAAGFPIVLTLIHWPEPGVHLSIHRALHPIVQHDAIAGDTLGIPR